MNDGIHYDYFIVDRALSFVFVNLMLSFAPVFNGVLAQYFAQSRTTEYSANAARLSGFLNDN